MSENSAVGPSDVAPVAEQAGDRLGLGFVVGAWVLFGLAHTVVRIIGNGQLGTADGLSMMAAQELNVAYQVGQPPLYDWTLWLIQQVTGPTAFSAYLNKYIYMTIAGVFVYLGAHAATGHRITGVLASLSLMLLFNVGISIHDQSTHSVAMIAALAATYYAFVMIAVRGVWRDYIVLGLAMGFGILSKYGYVLMPAAFAAAFLCSPKLRWKMLSVKSAAAVAIALALALPFVWWLSAHKSDFAVRAGMALVGDAHGSYFIRVLRGLGRLIGSFIVYATPAIPILWVIWPKLLTRWTSLAEMRAGSLPAITGLAIGIAFAAAVVLVCATGIDLMRSRYMHVLALLLPVYAVTYLELTDFTRARVSAFLAVLFAVQAVPIAGRALAPVFPVKPFCSSCSIIQPIDKLAAELEKRGFDKAVILLDYESARLGGNLRRYLPDASLRSYRVPTIGRDDVEHYEGCVLLNALDDAPPAVSARMSAGAEIITIAWPTGLNGPQRTSKWAIRRMPASEPRCAIQR